MGEKTGNVRPISVQVPPDLAGIKPVASMHIDLYPDGNINITGPIGNPIFTMEVFGKALSTIANHLALSDKKRDNIVFILMNLIGNNLSTIANHLISKEIAKGKGNGKGNA